MIKATITFAYNVYNILTDVTEAQSWGVSV